MGNIAYNVDCMEYMRTLPDKAFDLAVVDPPYGISINNNMGRRKGDKPSNYKRVTWDDEIPDKIYFEELFRVSKHAIIWGAIIFIFRQRNAFWYGENRKLVRTYRFLCLNMRGQIWTEHQKSLLGCQMKKIDSTRRKNLFRFMRGFSTGTQNVVTKFLIHTLGAVPAV